MDKKTIKNYIYNLSYQILLVLTPLVTAPYISHILHPKGVGIYSYTLTIATAFSLFAALGINAYGQREIAYKQENIEDRSIVFWELIIIRLIMTFFVTIIYFIFSFFYKSYTIYLLQQVFIIISVGFDISWFFQGIEDFRIIAIRNVFVKVASIVLIFMFVKNQTHIGRYILINSFSTFFSCLIFCFCLQHKIIKIEFKKLNLKKHIKGTCEFFVPLIATQIYSQLDKIMLGAITNNVIENGYYEQARKIVNILILIITSINSVMYSRISVLYAKNKTEEIKEMYQKTFRIIVFMLVPIVIGLWLVSDNFVLWFFGNDYIPVALLMKLSGFLIVFLGIGNFVGMQYLSPTGKQNQMTTVYIFAALINCMLNCILINKYQSVGAIIASIIAEAFSGIVQIVLLQKSNYKFKLYDGIWKYFVAGAIMGVVLLYIQKFLLFKGIALTFMQIFIGALIYVVFLFLEKEENIVVIINRIRKKI